MILVKFIQDRVVEEVKEVDIKTWKGKVPERMETIQHPEHQEIELNDAVQDMLMPGKVQNLNDAYSSITTPNNKSRGQNFVFILEKKSRQLKA